MAGRGGGRHPAAAARARAIVMDTERAPGLGYHIESRVPGTGKLRFIEVRVASTTPRPSP